MFNFGKTEYYYALLEGSTDNLLLFIDNYADLLDVNDFFLDSQIVTVTPSNLFTKLFYKSLLNSKEQYIFTWSRKTNTFVKNRDVNKELTETSQLTYSKYSNLKKIKNFIENFRFFEKKRLAFQDEIYTTKKIEANRFKDKNYPESEIFDYPYVKQYAEYKNLSFKQSADSIILKAKLNEGPFLFSEILRLKYFNLIKDANTIDEVEKIYKNFVMEHDYKY